MNRRGPPDDSRAPGIGCGRRGRGRAGDPRLDDDPRAAAALSGRARGTADGRDPVPVRSLWRRRSRAVDPRREAAQARSAGRAPRRSRRWSTTGPTRSRSRTPRVESRDGDRHRPRDVGRSLPGARRGRGTSPREGALHGRPGAGAARLARGDRALAARARPGHRRRVGRARAAGRARRPHGDDVARLSKPFAAGIDSPAPQYAAAVGIARYVGEPLAVVVARDRYLAEDAAELVSVDYDPLEPIVDVTAAEPIHERSFHYGDVDDALERADVVVRTTFRVPRSTGLPVECYGVVCDWDGAAGRLTAWANFQGPFTLHGVAAAALGLRGDRLRLLTPPDSGGSTGSRQPCCRTSCSSGLPPAWSGVPVRWTEDRLEHLAASAVSTGRVTEVEAGFSSDGELVALRYDALEDVGAYVRAPEPATLYRMHGSLSGAYRVRNVAARNRVALTNTIPSGLNRGFGGPQLYFGLERTMAIAARRLGSIPPSSHGGTSFLPTRSRTARPRARSTTRVTTPRVSSGRSSSRGGTSYAGARRPRRPRGGSSASGSRASSSRRSRTSATSRSRRPWSSERRRCRSRETRKARPSRSTRSEGSP